MGKTIRGRKNQGMTTTWRDCLEVDDATEERFISPENVLPLAKNDVHLCGVMKAKQHYRVCRTRPGFHVFLYTIHGQARLFTPNNTLSIEANTLSLVPADSICGYELVGDEWECAWLSVDNTRQWQTLSGSAPEVMHCEQALSVYHLMHLLHHELKAIHVNDGSVGSCGQLLVDLIRRSLQQRAVVDPIEVKLRQLFSEVENQLHYPWSIEELAARVHYSPPHFHRICLKYFEQSPKQYLLALRMTRARQLLQGQHLSIKQVAHSLGYFDVSYFSNRFKKHFGVAPGAVQRIANYSESASAIGTEA